MKLYKQQVRIGIITVTALVLTYFGINFLKGINIFRKSNTYYAYFTDVSNVNIASPVIFQGYKVGIVKAMDFDYEAGKGTRVTMDLKKGMKVPKGLEVAINQTALSGAEVHFVSGAEGLDYKHILPPGSRLPITTSGSDLIATATHKIFPAVVSILPKLDSTMTSLARIMSSPDIPETLRAIHIASENLQESMRGINRIVNKDLAPIMTNLRGSTQNINQVTGELSKFDMDEVKRSLDNIETLTAELRTAANKLKEKDNTAGLLLNDDRLYNRLDSLANSADELLRDVKARPKRYVRFSLF